METSEPARRRRRRRATRAQGTPAQPAPAPTPADIPPAAPPDAAKKRRRPARESGAEGGGLRDLVGAGRSQLGVSGALRARDANRPTDEDLAEAERDVEIVRRNWKPGR